MVKTFFFQMGYQVDTWICEGVSEKRATFSARFRPDSVMSVKERETHREREREIEGESQLGLGLGRSGVGTNRPLGTQPNQEPTQPPSGTHQEPIRSSPDAI